MPPQCAITRAMPSPVAPARFDTVREYPLLRPSVGPAWACRTRSRDLDRWRTVVRYARPARFGGPTGRAILGPATTITSSPDGPPAFAVAPWWYSPSRPVVARSRSGSLLRLLIPVRRDDDGRPHHACPPRRPLRPAAPPPTGCHEPGVARRRQRAGVRARGTTIAASRRRSGARAEPRGALRPRARPHTSARRESRSDGRPSGRRAPRTTRTRTPPRSSFERTPP